MDLLRLVGVTARLGLRHHMPTLLVLALGLLPVLTFAASPAVGTLSHSRNVSRTVPGSALLLGKGVTVADEHPALLLRIEYPGGITRAALDTLRKHVRAGDEFAASMTDDEIEERIQDQVNRSAYYALRLYQFLLDTKQLPEETVLAESVIIDRAPGSPGLTVVRSAHRVPAVLTLRFIARRSATMDISRPDMFVYANSFGKWLAPQMALFTEAGAWPGSAGVIALYGWGAAQKGPIQRSCNPENCLAAIDDFDDNLQGPFTPGRARAMYSPSTVDLSKVVDELPYGRTVKIDQEPVHECPRDSLSADGFVTPCPHEQLALALIMQALAQVNPYLAMRAQWRNYIAALDPPLAARWPGGVLAENERVRLGLIKKLMRAERRYLSGYSRLFARTQLVGAVGSKMREQLAAEQLTADEIRATTTGLIPVLLQLSKLVHSARSYRDAVESRDVLAAANAVADVPEVVSGTDRLTAIEALESNFAVNYGQSYSALHGTRFTETIDSRELQADNIGQLRKRFLEIYAKAPLPEIAAPNPRCRKASDEDDIVRGWTGDCADARPAGSGFAYVFAADGGGFVGTFERDVNEEGFVTYFSFASMIHNGKFIDVHSSAEATRIVQHTRGVNLQLAHSAVLLASIPGKPFTASESGILSGVEVRLVWQSNGESAIVSEFDGSERSPTATELRMAQSAWREWQRRRNALINYE